MPLQRMIVDFIFHTADSNDGFLVDLNWFLDSLQRVWSEWYLTSSTRAVLTSSVIILTISKWSEVGMSISEMSIGDIGAYYSILRIYTLRDSN